MAGANNARVRIIVSVGILLSLCAAWGQQVAQKPTDASAPPKNNTKPTPLVNADQDQAMFLGRVEQLIVEKSYRDAIRLLQQLIDKAEGFFEASSDGRQYVSMRAKASELLGRMGQEGLDLYRGMYDSQAQRLFEEGQSACDMATLQRVIDRYQHTTAGPQAMNAMAALYFDGGKFFQAAYYWRQLAMMDPKAAASAVCRAKAAIALHLAGETAAADAACEELQKDCPKAKGFLDGQDRPLLEFVQQLRKTAVATVVGPAINSTSGYPGQGALPGGYTRMPDVDVVLAWRWRRPEVELASSTDQLKNLLVVKTSLMNMAQYYGGGQVKTMAELRNGHVRIRTTGGQQNGYPPGLGNYALPSMIHPVVADGKVIIRTADRVMAFGLLDGDLKWASEQPLIRPLSAADARSFQPFYQQPGKMVDAGRYGATVGGGKVYVLSHFRQPMQPNMNMGFQPGGPAAKSEGLADTSRIVALWANSGKLVDGWDVGCGKGNDEILKNGKFLSAPAYSNGRLYVTAVYLENGFYLLCLNANDGSLIWKQFVAQAPAINNNFGQISGDSNHLGTSPVLADGKVFAMTNLGVVVACDASSGQPLWAYQYESQSEGGAGRNQPWMGYPQQSSLRSASPMIVVHGRVICLPADSSKVVALSAEDGSLAWASDRHACADLTGIDESRFLLSGEGLCVLSTQDGQDLFNGAGAIAGVIGRPAVAGNSILASGQGVLYRVSLDNYQISKVDLSDAEGLLGDLVSVDGKLIAANSLGVCSYFKFEDARDELTRRIDSAKGDDKFEATLHRALLAFNAGRYPEAVTDFQAVLQSSLAEKARPGLYRTYVAMGNAAPKGEEMVRHFQSALGIADTPTEKAQMKLRLAKALLKEGQFDKAAAMAQELSEELPKEEIVNTAIGPDAKDTARFGVKEPTHPAKDLAQDFIHELLKAQGRACFKTFEDLAEKDYRAALQAADADKLEAVWSRWPNAACSHDALYAAAELSFKASLAKSDEEARLRAKRLLSIIHNDRSSPRYVPATVALAAIYSREEGPDKTGSIYAAALLDRMRDQPPTTEIAFADLKGNLKDLLEKIDGGQLPKLTAGGMLPSAVSIPLREAFTLPDADCFLLRDQDGKVVRIGESVAILKGSRVVLLDASAKDEESATENWSGLTTANGANVRKRQQQFTGLQLTCGLSADRKVLAVGDTDAVTGLNAATAKIVWQKKMSEMGIVGQCFLSIGAGYLVVTDQSSNIACVNLATGDHWQNTLPAKGDPQRGIPAGVVGVPQIGGGVVAVSTEQSRTLAVYSLKTGKILQKYPSKRVADAMVTPDGLLVTLVDDEVAVREGTQLDKPLWSRKYEDAANQPRMLLAVNKDQVAVSLQQNKVEVLNITGGGQVANTLRLDASTMAIDAQFSEKALYVVTVPNNIGFQSRRANVMSYGPQLQSFTVVRYEADGNGEPAWKRAIEPEPNTASWLVPLVVGQQQVIVTVKNQRPDLPGKFVILDAKTGAVLDKTLTMLGRTAESKGDRTRANALGTPALLDGRLVVETLEGVTVYGK